MLTYENNTTYKIIRRRTCYLYTGVIYWRNDSREYVCAYMCVKNARNIKVIGNNINTADKRKIRDINHYYLLATRHLYSIFKRYAITPWRLAFIYASSLFPPAILFPVMFAYCDT